MRWWAAVLAGAALVAVGCDSEDETSGPTGAAASGAGAAAGSGGGGGQGGSAGVGGGGGDGGGAGGVGGSGGAGGEGAGDLSPHYGDVVINEVLADGATDEDANQDGSIDAMEDEFVELVNVSAQSIDISGWVMFETDWDEFLPRHTFDASTTLTPDMAAVVFGGGDPPASTSTVLYFPANAQDPGTSYGLDLDNDGDRLTLVDAQGLIVGVFAFGNEGGIAATSDESMTRDPDLTGDFEAHTQAAGAGGAIFSPGTRVDGSAF